MYFKTTLILTGTHVRILLLLNDAADGKEDTFNFTKKKEQGSSMNRTDGPYQN